MIDGSNQAFGFRLGLGSSGEGKIEKMKKKTLKWQVACTFIYSVSPIFNPKGWVKEENEWMDGWLG